MNRILADSEKMMIEGHAQDSATGPAVCREGVRSTQTSVREVGTGMPYEPHEVRD
ncbi:MAG: hypothetical protein JWL58_579 [Streptosporangiaceae bacterium]|jgi:hypothetical protein|nr:hypothetical protein [Streptosporangiaceae bacterium]